MKEINQKDTIDKIKKRSYNSIIFIRFKYSYLEIECKTRLFFIQGIIDNVYHR